MGQKMSVKAKFEGHVFGRCLFPVVAPGAPGADGVVQVFVADWINHTVHKFNGMNGKKLLSFGKEGEGYEPEQMSGPAGIAISESGEIYVADYRRQRVAVWSAEGTYLREIRIPGQLQKAHSVAFNYKTKELHICDNEEGKIFMVTEAGDLISSYGVKGKKGEPGQLYEPSSIVIDSERGLVAVSDKTAQISVFNLTTGEFVRFIKGPKAPFGGGSTYLAVDTKNGLLIVSDEEKGNTQAVTWEGEFVGGFGKGMENTGLGWNSLYGAAVGPHGELYQIGWREGKGYEILRFGAPEAPFTWTAK